MRRAVAAFAAAALLASPIAAARGTGHSSHEGRAYTGVTRDAHGKIARNPLAKEEFRRSGLCPATGKAYGACPGGWVVDHAQALKHGGADDPSNMQWQTTADAKAKDEWE